LSMGADNNMDFENSTNFACETDFVKGSSEELDGYHRVVTCLRAYKKYPGLYDSQLLVFTHTGNVILKSYLSLSAVEKNQIKAFNKRFVEHNL